MGNVSYYDRMQQERQREKELRLTAHPLGTTPDTAAVDTTQAEASHQAINSGMSNGINWLLLGLGIVLAPFTLGVGFLLSIYAAVRMSGGSHMVTDAIPTASDTIAPASGCMRILASIFCLVCLVVVVMFVVSLVLWNMGMLAALPIAEVLL